MVSTVATVGPKMACDLVRCGVVVVICWWLPDGLVWWWRSAGGYLMGWCSIGMEKAHKLYRPMGYVVERPICVWLVARLLVLRWVDGGDGLTCGPIN